MKSADRRRLALGVLLVAIAAVSVTAGEARLNAARLTLDGKTFRPELALTTSARAKGLMNRKEAPADGMLFVFPGPTSTGFWMKNTRVPLTIVFFNVEGRRVQRLSMTPCRTDSCRMYTPRAPYRFALELRADDRRPARRLGPEAELRRLSRIAR